MSLGVARRELDHCLPGGVRQLHLERLDDGVGDLFLDREHVLGQPVVLRRPDVVAAGDVDQLRRDAQPVAGLAHAPLEHRGHAELPPDEQPVLDPSRRRERRGARSDTQPLDMRQVRDDLLGDALTEVLLIVVGAHVDERQDRDRRLAAGERRPERLARQTQIGQHLGHARVAILGALGQRTRHDAVELGRNLRIDQRDGLGLVAQDRSHQLGGRVAGERQASREHLVEHHTPRPDVATRVDGLAAQVLRSHVDRGSAGELGSRARFVTLRHQRQTEVHDAHRALGVDDDVAALDVAVDDAPLVRCLEPSRQLHRYP